MLTRRTMLKDGFAAAMVAAYSTVLVDSLWAEPIIKLPGIQLYTVDKELKQDVEGTLKKVRAIGYREVETAGFANYSPQHFRIALKTPASSAAALTSLTLAAPTLDLCSKRQMRLGFITW